MMCFRDMSFCASDCTRTACRRHFGEPERQAARQWWEHDPDNAPIAYAPWHEACPDYQPKGKQDD